VLCRTAQPAHLPSTVKLPADTLITKPSASAHMRADVLLTRVLPAPPPVALRLLNRRSQLVELRLNLDDEQVVSTGAKAFEEVRLVQREGATGVK
jgi:hypothetical protein